MRDSQICISDRAQTEGGCVFSCGEDVTLVGAKLMFGGPNSVVFIGAHNRSLRIEVDVHGGCVFAIGSKTYTNGPLHASVSEGRSLLIGDRGLFSFGVWIRTADPHLVYRIEDMWRINPSRDVIVGDHVWLGQSSLLLKGTTIGSGSIVGAASVVAGKTIPSNTSWAGNPARQIAQGVFFDGASVHEWTPEQTAQSEFFSSKKWIYGKAPARDRSGLVKLAERLSLTRDPQKRLALVEEAYARTARSRFAIAEEAVENKSGEGGISKSLRVLKKKIAGKLGIRSKG